MGVKDEKEKVPFYCSWVVIAIVTILIWPLGALLTWRRGQFSRKTCLNLGFMSMVFGGIFIVGAIIAGYMFGDTFMSMCAVYGICGVVFARMGYEGYKKSIVYRRIITEVEDEGTLTISMLADEIGMSEVDLLKNLDAMFKKNLLPGHELAHNNKRLVKK